jgi:hypothetical protein
METAMRPFIADPIPDPIPAPAPPPDAFEIVLFIEAIDTAIKAPDVSVDNIIGAKLTGVKKLRVLNNCGQLIVF